jgi:hypothetical protein
MALGEIVATIEGKSSTPECTGTGYMDDITYTTNVSLKVDGKLGKGIGCWTQIAPTRTSDSIYPIRYFGLLTFQLPSGEFTKEKIQGWGTCEDSNAIATWKYCSVFLIGGHSYAVEHWWDFKTETVRGYIYEWKLADSFA